MTAVSTNSRKGCRLLIIGLDGLELSYAETLMSQGAMPALSALRDRSATFRLDHGAAQRTGLAWEHFASGLSPRDANRWSAVEFDPHSYRVWQEGARFTPFLERLGVGVTVFDAPYVDLRQTTRIEGIVGWGAHDPGTELRGRPSALARAFHKSFGGYPAAKWTYGLPAYSAGACEQMGEALAAAVRRRCDAALWMMKRRAGGDVFYVVSGEAHSAIEALWHGVDPQHPLHGHASTEAAATALRDVHRALDRLVADLVDAVGAADVLAFSMGGMGVNRSDLQSMALLPELLYRESFGSALLRVPEAWTNDPDAVLEIERHQGWNDNRRWYPSLQPHGRSRRGLPEGLRRRLRGVVRRLPRRNRLPPPADAGGTFEAIRSALDWQPAQRYSAWWPEMHAFALPSFYDGRIRINLQGRERHGRVAPGDYARTLDALEALVRECTDPRTGESAVAKVERPELADPMALASSDADLTVIWRSPANALQHPRHGLLGPLPYRRTGGHTGPYGVAYVSCERIAPGCYGERSSFDVAPTVVDLLSAKRPRPMSGSSLLETVTPSG